MAALAAFLASSFRNDPWWLLALYLLGTAFVTLIVLSLFVAAWRHLGGPARQGTITNVPNLAFEHNTIFRGNWSWNGLEDPQVCYVRNRQLNIDEGAKGVIARIEFSRLEPKTTFTLTEATWLPINDQGPITSSSVRSSVDLAGNEMQPFVVLIKQKNGALWAYKGDAPIGICDTGIWTLTITLIPTNGKILKGSIDLTVTRDKVFKWGELRS